MPHCKTDILIHRLKYAQGVFSLRKCTIPRQSAISQHFMIALSFSMVVNIDCVLWDGLIFLTSKLCFQAEIGFTAQVPCPKYPYPLCPTQVYRLTIPQLCDKMTSVHRIGGVTMPVYSSRREMEEISFGTHRINTEAYERAHKICRCDRELFR